MKKIILYLVTAVHLFLAAVPMNAFAMAPASGISSIVLSGIKRAPDIKWQYKVVDNVLYRRLYNYSTKTPLTDWEIVP